MLVRRAGFNLVEILITLSIVALLTTVVVNAVSDYKDKLRLVVVKNDLMLLAQMCKYVESTQKTLVQTISDGATELSTELNNFIIKIPNEDPWGRQYFLAEDGAVTTTDSGGMAYIIDRGMGRIISPGPDGSCNTVIGRGIADKERDVVVEYRQKQWLMYNLNDGIFLVRGDGSIDPIFLCAGTQLDVSHDRQTFVFIHPASFLLQWGRVDENPQIRSTVSNWTGDDGSYPFFAPDGVNVVVTRKDGTDRNIYSVNTNTGEERRLTGDMPLTDLGASYYGGTLEAKPRTVFNDGRSSFFHFVLSDAINSGIFIAVSSDGKVCFHNCAATHKGIEVVLLNGTGRRTVIRDTINNPAVKWFRPLFWLDTETIVYMDYGHKMLYRIKQDGSYNVALYPDPQNGTPTSQSAPFLGFAPSPDRSMVGFSCKTALGNYRGYRIVRTDGSGCLMDYAQSQVQSNIATGSGPVSFPALWPRRGIRLGAEYRQQIFVPAFDDTSIDLMQELEIVQTGSRYYFIDVGSNSGNQDQGLRPISWDLDQSGNLIAVVSRAVGASQKDGVFIYSITGPQGATTDLTRNMAVGDRRPLDAKFSAIFWIK